MKIHLRRAGRLSRSLGGDICLALVLIIFGAFMILPFLYAVMQSLKPTEEIFAFPPRFFVMHPTLDNFYMLTQAMNDTWVPVGRYFLNSLFVTGVATAGQILVSALGAYPLAKMHFRGQKAISALIVYALLFTAPVTAFPQYIIMAKCGMIDTYSAMILPAVAMPISIFLLKNFMSQLPDSVLEAAKIDGASHYGTFWRIAVPNIRPAMLTLLIFTIQNVWNTDTGMRFVYTEALKPLPLMLSQIASSGLSRAGVGAAVTVVIMLVPITVFLITQSNIMETMAFSGIKE